MKTDFHIRNEGTIVFLLPESERAEQWISNNIPLESWQDKNNIPIESRMFEEIHKAIISEGLLIESS